MPREPCHNCCFIGKAQQPGGDLTDLHTSVVIDYQNVHLTGHGLYESTELLPRHEALVDPLLFASRLLQVRNQSQRPGHPHAAGVEMEQAASGRSSITTVRFTGSLRQGKRHHPALIHLSDQRNLWPEPGHSPNPKDKVEDVLHQRVCAGSLSLAQAQQRIATDWTTAAG
jgi:hypothetical protein